MPLDNPETERERKTRSGGERVAERSAGRGGPAVDMSHGTAGDCESEEERRNFVNCGAVISSATIGRDRERAMRIKFGWTLQHTIEHAFGKCLFEKETDYRQSHLCHKITV